MSELLLVAAGGLAREVLAAVRARGRYDVVGILDDDAGRRGPAGRRPILGGERGPATTGSPRGRLRGAGPGPARIVARLAELGSRPERYATVVHPSVGGAAGVRARPRAASCWPGGADRRGTVGSTWW